MSELKYYVLLPNINNEKDFKFNVFNNIRFLSYLMDLKARAKKDDTINIKEEIRHSLQYSYWSKSECEIMVKCLFGKVEHKIDVYEQIMLNFDLFYEYLISNWKHIPAKTYKQQANQKKKKEMKSE